MRNINISSIIKIEKITCGNNNGVLKIKYNFVISSQKKPNFTDTRSFTLDAGNLLSKFKPGGNVPPDLPDHNISFTNAFSVVGSSAIKTIVLSH